MIACWRTGPTAEGRNSAFWSNTTRNSGHYGSLSVPRCHTIGERSEGLVRWRDGGQREGRITHGIERER